MELSELLDIHLDKHTHSKVTFQTYNAVVKRFSNETGITSLEALNSDKLGVIIAWRDNVLSRASGSTWNNYRRHLKALVNTACKQGFIDKNIFINLKPVRESHKKKTLSLHELKSIMSSVEQGEVIQPSFFWLSLIQVLYYTGMRRRQIVGLKWEDVNIKSKIVILKSSDSKTDIETRPIPINDALVKIFKNLYRVSSLRGKKDQIFNITLFSPAHNRKTDFMTVEQVTYGFRKISRVTGIRISAHRIRHTMATIIANESVKGGAPTTALKALQDMLGHTSIKTTCGYIHADTEAQRCLVSNLEKL